MICNTCCAGAASEGLAFSFSHGSLASVKPVSSLMIAMRGSQENCWYCVPNCSTCVAAEAANQPCYVCLSLSQIYYNSNMLFYSSNVFFTTISWRQSQVAAEVLHLGFTVVLPLVADYVERAAGLHRLQLVMRVVHQEECGQCLG